MKELFFKYYNLILNKYFNRARYHKVLFGPLRGKYMYMPLNAGVRMVLGTYEVPFANSIYNAIKKGDCCLDLGSHVGYITMLMAKKTGPKGKVISFEPLKKDCELQEKSAEKNKFNNVIINNFGVGDKNIKKDAYVFDDSGMAHFGKNVPDAVYRVETQVLELRKLDDYYKEENMERLDFIKIDIEGYEHLALKGAENIIEKFKPKLFIEIHSEECMEEVFRLLKKHDYKVFDLNNKPYDFKRLFKGIFHIYAK